MLKSIQWNIYTVLMVALVPAMLLTAWGMQAYEARQLHRRQCEVAVEWLESSTALNSQFRNAGTVGRTQLWISSLEELDSPNAAGYLRWGILESARYSLKYHPDLATSDPGVLNPKNGLFERQIEEGAEHLIDHCPETEAMIPTAFPMISREDRP